MKKISELDQVKVEYVRLWILAAIAFIVSPLIAMCFASSGDESPLFTSISRLGWITGHKALMYFWGATLLVPMTYTMWYAMEYAEINKVGRQLVKWCTIAFATIVFVGSLIPAHDPGEDFSNTVRDSMALAHDHMSRIGMFGIVGVLLGYCVFAFIAKKWEHATMMTLFSLFIIGSGVYAFIEVKDATTYCGVSAVTQIYAFGMMLIFMFVTYYYWAKKHIKKLKAEKVQKIAEESEEKIEE